ncbi:tetratricopeptide repeat protein [Pseudomonas sp. BJa5]|uniref:tetratricopeptide repeat protein n=1 Tax=Pseudomonas sp. BJa5 TaxID=2936270 RepID=UPI0025598EA2|nr:tetratricopeptide repeat protein [Pseudomonas sp. BGr12]MDL2419770.1 tetratricopeptide repeat protein [Pseudomonas sp. BGr12]
MPTTCFLPGILLAFCAVASQGAVAAERNAAIQSNKASTALIETASQQYADGQMEQAAATLERALQIQPNNPATLHYLGVLRLEQGQYEQAETLALRSNVGVGNNVMLRNRNFQLIEAAQKAQAASTPAAAQKDRGAIRAWLEGLFEKSPDAEVASAGQSTPEAERPSDALDRKAAGRPVAEGDKQMASLERASTDHEIRIPRGHWPPPGQCRIWFPDRSAEQQPAATSCKKLHKRVPPGAILMQG